MTAWMLQLHADAQRFKWQALCYIHCNCFSQLHLALSHTKYLYIYWGDNIAVIKWQLSRLYSNSTISTYNSKDSFHSESEPRIVFVVRFFQSQCQLMHSVLISKRDVLEGWKPEWLHVVENGIRIRAGRYGNTSRFLKLRHEVVNLIYKTIHLW